MKWDDLLCATRVRELYGGEPSFRSESDTRSEFARDFNRAVFSTPVRRLQDKAQLFAADSHDSVHTRLTHSLEVSTLARDLGRAAGRWLVKDRDLEPKHVYDLECIAATCGLIHDIGNPPFGHAGEQAIRDWFKDRAGNGLRVFGEMTNGCRFSREQLVNDFLNFEGNAQTLRHLARLQLVSDDYGLNLTCGTLSAATKYVAASHETTREHHERKKPGYFASEAPLIEAVRERTGTGEARHPLTYLVEASDDIVYCTVDLEDAVRKGVLTWALVEDEIQRMSGGECLDRVRQYVGRRDWEDIGTDYDEAMVQMFRAFAIGDLAAAALEEFKAQYDDIMAGEYHGELVPHSAQAELFAACRSLTENHVFTSPEKVGPEVVGRKVIQDLMDLFFEGSSSPESRIETYAGKLYSLMSRKYRAVFERTHAAGEYPGWYCQAQLVTDYVCGMTDGFAAQSHKELTNRA